MEYDTDLVNKKGKGNTAGNTGVKKICKVWRFSEKKVEACENDMDHRTSQQDHDVHFLKAQKNTINLHIET